MAHNEQVEFLEYIKTNFPSYFEGNKTVLDVGSADINGNHKGLFDGCDDLNYYGCDVVKAPNVDVVGFCHELSFDDEYFDVIVSGECFEHDMYWTASLRKIYKMLKPGGLFFFTCATTGRPEHGTSKTSPLDSYSTQLGIEWYKNITDADVSMVLPMDKHFKEHQFYVNNNTHDLYFYGTKHDSDTLTNQPEPQIIIVEPRSFGT